MGGSESKRQLTHARYDAKNVAFSFQNKGYDDAIERCFYYHCGMWVYDQDETSDGAKAAKFVRRVARNKKPELCDLEILCK
jgi:hypothetical protein